LKTYKDELKILEDAYTIREFAIFLGKPLQNAKPKDKEKYLEHKKENNESITGNRLREVSSKSLDAYRYRLNNFYRWILKHTNEEIDQELAYPKPVIVRKKEISLEELCEKRIETLLDNKTIYYDKKIDSSLTIEELEEKYPHQFLDQENLDILIDIKSINSRVEKLRVVWDLSQNSIFYKEIIKSYCEYAVKFFENI
jgi:hypothetical protein